MCIIPYFELSQAHHRSPYSPTHPPIPIPAYVIAMMAIHDPETYRKYTEAGSSPGRTSHQTKRLSRHLHVCTLRDLRDTRLLLPHHSGPRIQQHINTQHVQHPHPVPVPLPQQRPTQGIPSTIRPDQKKRLISQLGVGFELYPLHMKSRNQRRKACIQVSSTPTRRKRGLNQHKPLA